MSSKKTSDELLIDNIIERYTNCENIVEYIKKLDIDYLSDNNFLENIFNNSQDAKKTLKLSSTIQYVVKMGIKYNLSDLINSNIDPLFNGILHLINNELKYYRNDELIKRYKNIEYNKNILSEILKSNAILPMYKNRVFKFVYENLDYIITTDKDTDGYYIIYYMVSFYNNDIINLFTSDQIIETLINILFFSDDDINYNDLKVRASINNMISIIKIEDLKKELEQFSDNIDNYENIYIRKLLKGITKEIITDIIEEEEEDEFSF